MIETLYTSLPVILSIIIMYLEKLEIQGFKSFANKNTLIFPGLIGNDKRGITAVVGPNGSGKSNIADAVRWSLGEQSMKTLRGKKSEDIIFSGSDKKGRLGMAEVSLFLNNEDRKAPIDYSQVILTRRLYRNGESEYLINQSRVRLVDIQILLAKANFGQKTYSVIGQGMVEGFLNTTLAERKEFFDEATGVKQFQIRRDESLNKLIGSLTNLNQANLLLSEIEPRLKSLTRQVNKLKKRDEIQSELRQLQLNYYGKIWHQINEKFVEYNKKFLEIEKKKLEKEKKLTQLNTSLIDEERHEQNREELNKCQFELEALQKQKEAITKQLIKSETELELKLESRGQFDLSWFNKKRGEIKNEIEKIIDETEMHEKNINCEKDILTGLEKEKKLINYRIEDLNKNLLKYGPSIINDQINQKLKLLIDKLTQAFKEDSLINIKRIVKEIKNEIEEIISLNLTSDKNNLNDLQKNLVDLTRIKEELSTKIYESTFRISARTERVKLLLDKKNKLNEEAVNLENKIKLNNKTVTTKEKEEEKKQLVVKQKQNDEQIKRIKEGINSLNIASEENTKKLLTLQKDINNLQIEISNLNNKLNELKVGSTRYETKLEDLEIEIRNNLNDLKSVKEHKVEGEIDEEQIIEKINSLKRQVDQIGGIDPEIEKEYLGTKERYDFLLKQVNDLTNAIDSLEKIIRELDLNIKEKFDKEFKIISTKFEEYFKILFNGGQAKIIKILTDEIKETEGQIPEEKADEVKSTVSTNKREKTQNIFDTNKIKLLQKFNATGLAGIEIQACPPGKKIKSIAMLSGGERALTAIALICAIISSNPSPFVVLDEVDAALDEANSERFAKILDDLSHKTQFIVITHNRTTMRRANIIYGVTMQDDGVSKLLSIKFEEAKVIAE